jgi:hypothetical protein
MARCSTRECYYCGRDATSIEHVPPKCLFPESKDASGEDLRLNLITVPSCDEHNLGKSKDDEFLMACLTPVVGNNRLGFLQTHTKLARAIERSSGRLLGAAVRDVRDVDLAVPGGGRLPVLIGRADMPRLCRVLEHVARGLFFHVFDRRFIGECNILPDFVWYKAEPSLEVIKELTKLHYLQERGDWSAYGDNERVFTAEVGPVDQYGLTPLVMTFFEGSRIYAAFKPEGVVFPFRTLDDASPENALRIEVHFGE